MPALSDIVEIIKSALSSVFQTDLPVSRQRFSPCRFSGGPPQKAGAFRYYGRLGEVLHIFNGKIGSYKILLDIAYAVIHMAAVFYAYKGRKVIFIIKAIAIFLAFGSDKSLLSHRT